MAETTATILVGTPHNLTAGLEATHLIILRENSRAAWSLVRVGGPTDAADDVVWVPASPERILEDALILMTLRVFRSPSVEAAVERLPDPGALRGPHVDLTELEWFEEHAPRLDEAVHADETSAVIAFTILASSTLLGRLDDLCEVPWDVSVCSASWASSTSPFTNIRSVERGRDAIESHDEEPPRLIGGE